MHEWMCWRKLLKRVVMAAAPAGGCARQQGKPSCLLQCVPVQNTGVWLWNGCLGPSMRFFGPSWRRTCVGSCDCFCIFHSMFRWWFYIHSAVTAYWHGWITRDCQPAKQLAIQWHWFSNFFIASKALIDTDYLTDPHLKMYASQRPITETFYSSSSDSQLVYLSRAI